MYKICSLIFSVSGPDKQIEAEITNSPDSTTSLSGEVTGCGETERYGLAFQTTLLLSDNTPTLHFHLTVTTCSQ
jgi:hypothetical protein